MLAVMFDLSASLVEHHKELLSGHGDFLPDPVQILKLGDPDRGSARSQWFPGNLRPKGSTFFLGRT